MTATAPRAGRNGTITKGDRELFLHHVRDGLTRPEAARALDPEGKRGLTGSKFRSLCKRDPAFNDAYTDALIEGRRALEETIRTEYHRRALDPTKLSNRLLQNLAVCHLPEFEWMRKQRIEMTGAEGGPVEVANVEGAAERLRTKLANVVSLDEARKAQVRPRQARSG